MRRVWHSLKVASGSALGLLALLWLAGCGDAEPVVARVSPEEVRPGDTLAVTGSGLNDRVVKVGEVEAQVKSRAADSLLVVQVPGNLKPGEYDLVVTKQGAKASSKPVKVRVVGVVTVPAGTPLKVRLVESIGSGQNQVGDTVYLVLDEPVVVNGRTVADEGTRVLGRVTQANSAGRVKGRGEIEFTLVQLAPGARTYPLATESLLFQAQGTKKRDALTIGGGAGIGAAIGGLLGGKKGAIIGGTAGGAAGTGVVLATRGGEIDIASGTRFGFSLTQPVEVLMDPQVAVTGR